MNTKFKLSIVVIISIYFSACLNGGIVTATSNSSPKFSEDFSKVTDEIEKLSNSQSVDFVDITTTNDNDEIIEKELRIDLVKPKQFPGHKELRNIILAVKPKLIEFTKFTKYTVTEVETQHGDVIVFPAEKILKSVTIDAKNL